MSVTSHMGDARMRAEHKNHTAAVLLPQHAACHRGSQKLQRHAYTWPFLLLFAYLVAAVCPEYQQE